MPRPRPHDLVCPSSQSSTCEAINSIPKGGNAVASFVLRAEQDYRGGPGRDGDLSGMTQLAEVAFMTYKGTASSHLGTPLCQAFC